MTTRLRSRVWRWVWVAVGLAAVAATVAGIAGAGAAGPILAESSPTAPATPAAESGASTPGATRSGPSALAAVEQLTVKGRAPKTGYDRSAYGEGWAEAGGCSTRQIVLRRDLDDVAVTGRQGCELLGGTLHDPYTATTMRLTANTLRTVQIDHVVALEDSWQKGAQRWSSDRRVQFANDPLNLLVTSGSVNASKGAGDAATWLPPNRAFRCAYVARQVSVKLAYGLWVTPAEKAAMVRVLGACPTEPLLTAEQARQQHDPHPASDSSADAPEPTSADRRYPTCAAANRAGLGPYRRGVDPEYAWYRDADGDGVVCER